MSEKSNQNGLMVGLRYMGVGFGFMAEAGLVAALGWWLDGRFGTAPWLLVAGTMIGVTLATISLVKNIERLDKPKSSKGPGDGS
ncbi:MAG: AtpZ/AtpI family protein [Planctomycetota bacterium]